MILATFFRMVRSIVAIASAALLTMSAATPAWAQPRPGDSCNPTGAASTTTDGRAMTCQQGRWVLEGPPPLQGSSSVKKAKNFKVIGTALDASTFDSNGRQVADATGLRLQDGRIRLFAFVNSTETLPGTLSATSTSKTGTRFAADATTPLPGIPAGQPRVISLGGDTLRLFYVAQGNINAALSTDNGLTFIDEGPVITTAQAGFEPGGISIIRHKGTWRAYFSNLEKPGERTTRVMRTATSSDMLNWTMGPVITQNRGPLKAGGSHPFAVIDKGRIALYYAGDRDAFYGILVSTSKNGITFSNERSVIAGGGDPDLVRVGKNKWLMYYGADLGGGNFGVKVAKSVRPVVPRK